MRPRFMWFDLLTSDADAAAAFYTNAIGWTTNRAEETPAEYRRWVSSQGPLGGVVACAQSGSGMAPHWMGHVNVEDLDVAVAKVQALGGAARVPPTDIPQVGRYSVITDPQGVELSLFETLPGKEEPPRERSRPGEVNWSELHTHDAVGAIAFYRELFGWTVLQELEMGPAGTYFIFGIDGAQYGGMMTKMPDMPAAQWLHYVQVEDLDGAIARASSSGGEVLYGPVEIPGGRMAQLMDPQGAMFALHGT